MNLFSKKHLTILAPLFILLLIPRLGFCSQEDRVYQLGEIVVSAKHELVQETSTVDIVTSAEVEKSASVAEALTFLPGIHIRRGPRGEAYVRTRGFRQREVLILLDGIPLNSPYTGQNDLEQLPIENISKIVFVKGAASSLYGPNGMAGVINIVTKQGTEKVHAFLDAKGAEESTYYTKGGVGKQQGMLSYFFSGHCLSSDGYTLSDSFQVTDLQEAGKRVNSDRERQGAHLNVGLNSQGIKSLSLMANYVEGEYGIPPLVEDGSDLGLSSPKFQRVDDFRHYDLRLAGEAELNPTFSARSALYKTFYSTETNTYDDITYSGVCQQNSGREKTEDQTDGMNLYGRVDLKKWGLVKFGLLYKSDQREAEGYWIIEEKVNKKKELKEIPFDVILKTRTYSFSSEYEITPWERTGFAAGVSYDVFDKKEGRDNQAEQAIFGGSDNHEWSPQLGAFYYWKPDTKLYASIAKKVRFPSLRELYETAYKKKQKVWVTSGNSDLRPEKSINYEIVLKQNFNQKAIVRLTYFYYDINNLIEKEDSTDIYQNVPAVSSQGAETEIDLFPTPNICFNCNYTYLYMEDKGELRQELQYRPKHKISLMSSYILPFKTKISADGFYVGSQYYYSNDYTKYKLDDYTVVNLRVSHPLGEYCEIYGGVKNVFDENYAESFALPLPGRYFSAGVKLTI